MNVVFIVPTGIGAEIGGHAGDATPALKLIASICDKVITHPNVVNASDINEMPGNCLYVEGSILDRFLIGDIELKEVRSNRILLAMNGSAAPEIINSVGAARAVMGADIQIMRLITPLKMRAFYDNKGKATGEVTGWQELVKQSDKYNFDALAISSAIDTDKSAALAYLRGKESVNPWGGVEAKTSKLIADYLNKPVAHAPQDNTVLATEFKEVVDSRRAAECVSISYIHCVLKGLHTAPRIGPGLSVADIDVLVSPWGCFGAPHKACEEAGIRMIFVRENKTVLNEEPRGNYVVVDNYWEAAGYIAGLKAGIVPLSARRIEE